MAGLAGTANAIKGDNLWITTKLQIHLLHWDYLVMVIAKYLSLSYLTRVYVTIYIQTAVGHPIAVFQKCISSVIDHLELI